MDYFKNVELALSLGFEEKLDKNAYKGKFYIKDRKIWIHYIESLKRKLNIDCDEKLRDLGYDIDSYYKYVDYTNTMVDHEIRVIKSFFTDNDSTLFGRYNILQCSETIKGMASLHEEGFDEEILADYARQMSKNR